MNAISVKVSRRAGRRACSAASTGQAQWQNGRRARSAATTTKNSTANCQLCHLGPLVVDTGKHTARAAADKFVVREQTTEERVHPAAVAMSHHGGHWAHGRYASGVDSPIHRPESEERLVWWQDHGSHVNRVIPVKGDPIGGAMCWNDAVVRVALVEA